MKKWTKKENTQLLHLSSDEELLVAFPNHKLESLRRRQRLLKEKGEKIETPKLELTPGELLIVLQKHKKGISLSSLADKFGSPLNAIKECVYELQAEGVLLNGIGEILRLATSVPTRYDPVPIDFRKHKEQEVCIGAIADTHLGSRYERLDVLESLYDRFASYGVRDVYLGGNMIDGEFRFNRYDIYVHGVEEQVANFVNKFPRREGVTTHFVTGDDHEGWYVLREHIDIGRVIVDRARDVGREDLDYLGHIERDIEFQQEGGSSIVRVIHAGGGSTYAISYTAQKYVESLQGGEKPSVVLVGHFHKFDYSYPREVHVVQVGCTQDQTPFMRKKRIQAMVGGTVIWLKQNDLGIFTSVKVEWLPFYDKKFYKYQW